MSERSSKASIKVSATCLEIRAATMEQVVEMFQDWSQRERRHVRAVHLSPRPDSCTLSAVLI